MAIRDSRGDSKWRPEPLMAVNVSGTRTPDTLADKIKKFRTDKLER